MTVPDPETVREIAHTAGLLIVETVARDHIVHAAMAQHGIGHDNVYAWSETYDRVLDELAAVLKPLTQPKEQQPAEATGGEQAQSGGPDDSFAMVAEGAPAGPARTVAEYWRDYAAAVSDGGRFTDWAQIAQVAAWILAAMDAEVEQVQDGTDTRAVAALLEAQADGASMAECKHAFAELRARFADRIAVLDDAETEES